MQDESLRIALEDTMSEYYLEALPPHQSIALSTPPPPPPPPHFDARWEAAMMGGTDILKRSLLILDDELDTALEHFHKPVRCNPVMNSTPATSLQCPHPGCQSKVLYTRKCDLEKHYRFHFRKYFCRIPGCALCEMNSLTVSGSGYGGFSTKKDRDRHEKSHFPALTCEYCGKLFSRRDNLRDHWRKRHYEKAVTHTGPTYASVLGDIGPMGYIDPYKTTYYLTPSEYIH